MTKRASTKFGVAVHYAIKIIIFKIVYPLIYRIWSVRKLRSRKVVFVEVRAPGLTDNFAALHEQLDRMGYEIRLHCLGLSTVGFFEYDRRCRAMIRDLAGAPLVFVNDGSNVLGCLPIRKGTTVVQTWHACGAFKRFGLGTAELAFGGSRREQRLFPTYKTNTLVTVSSPEVIWAYAQSMGLPEERILPLGISRTDVFFDAATVAGSGGKVRGQLRIPAGKKILLYAPTFRGDTATTAAAPEFLDLREAANRLGDEYFILIKYHPFVKNRPEIPAECEECAAYPPPDLDINELLMAADVCVTDYSSIIFEYSLLGRPMVFLAPDVAEYLDERGFYYPFAEFAPGPVASSTGELCDAVGKIKEGFDRDKIEAFREKFMSSCDGHATDRILEKLGIIYPK